MHGFDTRRCRRCRSCGNAIGYSLSVIRYSAVLSARAKALSRSFNNHRRGTSNLYVQNCQESALLHSFRLDTNACAIYEKMLASRNLLARAEWIDWAHVSNCKAMEDCHVGLGSTSITSWFWRNRASIGDTF